MHFLRIVDQLKLTIRIVSSYINVNLLYLIVAYSKSLKDRWRAEERMTVFNRFQKNRHL